MTETCHLVAFHSVLLQNGYMKNIHVIVQGPMASKVGCG